MPTHNLFGVPVVILSTVDAIEIDQVEQVTVRHDNLVTKNPTETGLNVTDHVVNLPVAISLTGRFTDAPLGVGLVTVPDPTAAFGLIPLTGVTAGLSVQNWKLLELLRDSKNLFDVVVQQGVYSSMVFTSLSAPRARGDGTSMRFQAEMTQVRLVNVLPTTTGAAAVGVSHSTDPTQSLGPQPVLAFP